MMRHPGVLATILLCRLSVIYPSSTIPAPGTAENVTAGGMESPSRTAWYNNERADIDHEDSGEDLEQDLNVSTLSYQEQGGQQDRTNYESVTTLGTFYQAPSPLQKDQSLPAKNDNYSPVAKLHTPNGSNTTWYIYDLRNHKIGSQIHPRTSKLQPKVYTDVSDMNITSDETETSNVNPNISSDVHRSMLHTRYYTRQPIQMKNPMKEGIGFFWEYPSWDYTKPVDIEVKLLYCISNEGIKISAVECLLIWDFANNTSQCEVLSECSEPQYFVVDVKNSVDNLPMFIVTLNTTQVAVYSPWLAPDHSFQRMYYATTHFTRLSVDDVSVITGFNLRGWLDPTNSQDYSAFPLRLWVAVDGCYVSEVYIAPTDCRTLLRLKLPSTTTTDFRNERFKELPLGNNDLQNITLYLFALDYHVVFTHVVNETDIYLFMAWLEANPYDRGPYVMQYIDVVNGNSSTSEPGLNNFSTSIEHSAKDAQMDPQNDADENTESDLTNLDYSHNISGLHFYDASKDKSNLSKSNDSHSPLYHLFHPKKNTSSNNSSGVAYIIRHALKSHGKYSHGKSSVHPHIGKSSSHGRGVHIEMKPPSVLMQSGPEDVSGGARIGLHNTFRQWERPGAKFTQAHLALLKRRGYPAHAFHGLIWEDREYLLSVLIPVILGVIGALGIVCLAYGVRSCQDTGDKFSQHRTATSRASHLDRVMLLSEPMEEEVPA